MYLFDDSLGSTTVSLGIRENGSLAVLGLLAGCCSVVVGSLFGLVVVASSLSLSPAGLEEDALRLDDFVGSAVGFDVGLGSGADLGLESEPEELDSESEDDVDGESDLIGEFAFSVSLESESAFTGAVVSGNWDFLMSSRNLVALSSSDSAALSELDCDPELEVESLIGSFFLGLFFSFVLASVMAVFLVADFSFLEADDDCVTGTVAAGVLLLVADSS